MPGLRKLLFIFFLLCAAGGQARAADSPVGMANDSIPSASDTLIEADITFIDSIPATADTLTQAMKDSLLKEARYILEALSEPHSFFTFETSIGNRNFSLHNNSFNALQLTTDKFTLVPTATYVHKSGFGASAAAYMTWDKNPQFFQYALSPSYDHFGKKFGYGVSYTYYMTRDDLEFYSTPIKHEFYGYINSKKGWLRPRLAAGWATGDFREITRFDTTILGIKRTIIDTSTVKLSGLTLMVSLTHDFNWYNIFSKVDNISLVPQISAIAGTENYETVRQGKFITHVLDRRIVRRYSRSEEDNSGFRLNSFAFSLNFSYYTGPLFISPQYMLSYFPGAKENSFSNIVALSIGVLF
jgi:hypothetical protein